MYFDFMARQASKNILKYAISTLSVCLSMSLRVLLLQEFGNCVELNVGGAFVNAANLAVPVEFLLR